MGLVLARAEQYDDRDARRESGHGGRSLDWVRPIAPVAHRTERSAPDRKAAGSIPARRTTSEEREPTGGRVIGRTPTSRGGVQPGRNEPGLAGLTQAVAGAGIPRPSWAMKV